MACDKAHVPDRLRKNQRDPVEVFEVNEEIYYRCLPEVLDNPYKGISICELSHNRQGLQINRLSEPNDVLINITGNGPNTYTDKVVCVLTIKDVDGTANTYNKTFTQEKDNIQHEARMKLIHDPDECMYPHSVFRVWLNEELINYNNYNLVDKLKQIKSGLKTALAAMIIQRQISQTTT